MAIDRRTQDSDVMERVLGVDGAPEGGEVHTELIDLAVLPWPGGAAVSAVQLTVRATSPRRSQPRRRR